MWAVKRAIAIPVALDEERRRMTHEALADVKAGRTHEHAEIEAWASGLAKPKHKTCG